MREPVEKSHSLQRLETFSDGVIAVALTILVLDLKPPEMLSVAVWQNPLDYTFLREMRPKMLAFFVSFVSVAGMWTALVSNFRQATRATQLLIWLTLLHLFFLCLIPWGAAFWSGHPTLRQAMAVYSGITWCALASGSLLHRQLALTFYPMDPLNRLNKVINVASLAVIGAGTAVAAFVPVYVVFTVVGVGLTILYATPRPLLARMLSHAPPSG